MGVNQWTPNIEALLQGAVSGQFSEWQGLRTEVAALIKERNALQCLARDVYGALGPRDNPTGDLDDDVRNIVQAHTACRLVQEELNRLRAQHEKGKWRVGGKVSLNVYEDDAPRFQCHTPEEAARVVTLLNRAEQGIPSSAFLERGDRIVIKHDKATESFVASWRGVFSAGETEAEAIIAVVRAHMMLKQSVSGAIRTASAFPTEEAHEYIGATETDSVPLSTVQQEQSLPPGMTPELLTLIANVTPHTYSCASQYGGGSKCDCLVSEIRDWAAWLRKHLCKCPKYCAYHWGENCKKGLTCTCSVESDAPGTTHSGECYWNDPR